MISVLWIFVGMMFFVFVMAMFSFVLWDKSFKNPVLIARQTGQDADTIIWVRDRYKVQQKDGYYYLRFRHRRVKTKDVESKFHTLFAKKRRDVAELTREEWDTYDMSKKVQRGLFLFETSQGMLQPMAVRFNDGYAALEVMGEDTRRWLAQEIKDVNELTRNRTKDILLLTAAVVCIAALAVVFIFGFIYMNEQGTKAIAANTGACTQYLDRLLNYTQAIERGSLVSQAADRVVGG